MAEPVVRDPAKPAAKPRQATRPGRRGTREGGPASSVAETGGSQARSKAPDALDQARAHLLDLLRTPPPQADLALVERAFALAVEAHRGQVRAWGEPYVTHPIAAALILVELGIDPVAVAAALLHDVPEDTEYSLADIEDGFGPEIAHLVDGVTKLSRFSTHSHEQQQAENIRKMFLAMADDI